MTGNELRRKVADIINAWDGATRGSAKHLEILNIYNNHKPLAKLFVDGDNLAHMDQVRIFDPVVCCQLGHRGKHERRQGGQAHHESERAVYPRFHYPGL